MKKLLAAVLSLCLALSLCAIPAMAATADFTTLIEECLTEEVSTAITKNFTLPENWGEETSIEWESSDSDVIEVSGNTAVVKRGIEDATVTLTATDLANPSNTKVLTFTVLSLFKKVWYNNNFYAPERYSAEDDGLSFGYRYWDNTRIVSAGKNNPYEFAEKTAENAGQAGFFRFTDNNLQTELIKVAQHPVDTNDYAILLESTGAAGGYALGLPGTGSELPSGEVFVSFRLAVGSADQKKWGFGFNGNLGVYNKQVMWRYNGATNGATTYTTWNETYNTNNNTPPAGFTPDTVNTYANSPVNNMVTTGDYLDASVTFSVKTANTELACIKTSTGDIPYGYNPYVHSKKIEGTNGLETDKVLKTIYFGTTGAGKMYVDDIVITTETTEIPGETADEKLAIYKRLLDSKLNEAIADKTKVTDDINLDVLNIEGYDVTWASSDTSAIVINGKTADVQLTEIIKDVTLTGTITHEDATPVTITLPLTVKPYGSSVVSVVGAAGSATGKVTYEDAATGNYTSGALNNMHKSAFSVEQEDGNKFATVTGGELRYGYGGWDGQIGGTYKTISFKAKIDKPAVLETANIRTAITLETRDSHIIAQIYIPYTVEEDGTVTKSKWYVADGSNTSADFRYVDDVKLETLPDLGKWFNVQLVLNSTSYTYDIYIDGVKLFDAAISYGAGHGSAYTANLYSMYFKSKVLDEDYSNTTVCWDDIEILSNNADIEKVSADLMLASIDSVDDKLKATEANGTEIAWAVNADGDATISEGNLVKSKDFGLGETTVTATATVPGKGTLSRVYNLYYGTEIQAVDVAGGMLNSIKYVSDVDAAGYIAYYDGDNALLRVDPVTLQAGRNTRVFDTELPEGYASLKVFAWNENLSPLSFAYPYPAN